MRQHSPLDPVTGIENATLAWANGNPATGVNGSYPPFGLFVDPQTEILNAQRAAGLPDSADGTDTAQLSQAISLGTQLGTLSTVAGNVNALAAALPGSVIWPALKIGMEFSGIVNATNTGAVVVTLTGFGTLPGPLNLVTRGGQALAKNDLVANVPFKFFFDGLQLRMRGSVPSDAARIYTSVQRLLYGTTSFTAGAAGLYLFGGFASGGGGGYAGTSTSAGGGGGAGGYDVLPLFLTQGQTIPIVIPLGGLGGVRSTGALATAGGTVSVNGIAIASGGSPGVSAGAANQAGGGGPGGIGLLGLQYAGGPGYQGYNTFYAGGQGGTPGGQGGGIGGQLSSGNGNLGIGFGSGGSGASNSGDGGNGSPGGIIVQYLG